MSHFKFDPRDALFTLEMLGVRDLLPHFTDSAGEGMDWDGVKDTLAFMHELAEEQLADAYRDADHNPPVWIPEEGRAEIPQSLQDASQAWWNSGLWQLGLNEELGGQPAPQSVVWAMRQILLGANPVVYMENAGFSEVIAAHGTEEQQGWARLMQDQRWTGAMVITEADAGSDVGVSRTSAEQQEDGTWHIQGTKRFITNATTEAKNRVYLVLARPDATVKGTKGLSLFLVFDHHFDASTGELLGKNGVTVTGILDKMGLKASTTGELAFGEKEPAVGYLLGDVHNGWKQMLEVIRHARLMVGAKSAATADTARRNAFEEAATREQGADLPHMTDKDAPRVRIIEHGLVRLSLAIQKAYAESLGALVLYTATLQDRAAVARAQGGDATPFEREEALLLPVTKGFASEEGFKVTVAAQQIFGGSGYSKELVAEQYVRDIRIDSIYEGTTVIQGLDAYFRNMFGPAKRPTFDALVDRIVAFTEECSADPRFAAEVAALSETAHNVRGIADHMQSVIDAATADNWELATHKVGLNTTRLLEGMGVMMAGWFQLHGAVLAQKALDEGVREQDRDFYVGKVETAHVFLNEEAFPRSIALLVAAKGVTGRVMRDGALGDRRDHRTVPVVVPDVVQPAAADVQEQRKSAGAPGEPARVHGHSRVGTPTAVPGARVRPAGMPPRIHDPRSPRGTSAL